MYQLAQCDFADSLAAGDQARGLRCRNFGRNAFQDAQGARSILEVGTLGGYSTIWLARALPADGRLVTLEADPQHADVARANIARAGLADIVEVRLGRALEMLPQIAAEGLGPFDLIFIDADKPSNSDYFALSVARGMSGFLRNSYCS